MTATDRAVAKFTVDGQRPRRRAVLVLCSVAAGLLLAVLWSYEFVDHVIGDSVANTLLGHDAKASAIGGSLAGLAFAFVSGLAGTFTACNIAMAAAIGPVGQASQAQLRVRPGRAPAPGRPPSLTRLALGAVGRSVAWLSLGMVAVAATYGAVGVLLGDALPQLSREVVGGVPARLVQSFVVFGLVGLVLTYLGLGAAGVVRDPFRTRPVARLVTFGALVGAFLIGRPYPLFNKLFHWAADTGNPLYGAGAFVLQSIGNIALVTLVVVLVVVATRGRFVTWLAERPARVMAITGCLMIAFGVFTVVYWDVRVPAMFGYGWFPRMPYN